MRVASKVGNLPSEFVNATPLGSRIIRYVRDGWTDRQTDGRTKATLLRPFQRSVAYKCDVFIRECKIRQD